MKKNDEITIDITDLSHDGDGIGRYCDMVFFVKGALPEERVSCIITALKKNYGYARLKNIILPSKDRINARCDDFGKCGGCSLMHLRYDAQLKYKQKQIQDVLIKIGGMDESDATKIISPIIGTDNPYHFRNKAQYPVSVDKNGLLNVGFFAKRSHRIIPCTDCQIGNPLDKKIIDTIIEWANQYNIPIYDESTKKGKLRHILIRHAIMTNETLVCLVSKGMINKTKKLNFSHIKELNLKSLSVNINKRHDNVILGDKTIILQGNRSITDRYTVLNNTFSVQISAESFYQVNHSQMEKLYTYAINYAELSGNETVWDIYCGIGTITMALSKYAKKVIGIEESPVAIKDAKENIKINQITNVSFIQNKAEDVFLNPENYKEISDIPDVVIIDPPRSGCKQSVLDAIIKAHPKKLIYISCNPSTFARDEKILKNGGLKLNHITPVDQFCHSPHCELVGVFL